LPQNPAVSKAGRPCFAIRWRRTAYLRGNEETEKIIDSLKSLFLPDEKKRSNLFSQSNFHSRFKEEMDATRSGFSIDDIIGEPSKKITPK
jgi:hypothetical protein